MRYKILMMLFVGLFLFTIVSADESGGLLKGKQFDCIELPQECASCTYSKITKIQYPNLSVNILNTQMTKNGTVYNYTFCDTSGIGDYSYCTLSDVDSTDTSACKPFEIRTSGFSLTVGYYFLLILLTVGIIVLGYYVQDAWVVVLGSFGLVLFGLFVLFYGVAGIKDPVYTWGIGIITLALGGYFGIKATLEKLD